LAYVEKKNFKGTFDDCFKFDDNCGKVILSNKDIQLNIQTDYPAINIYVDNTNSDMKFNNDNIFPLRRGIALETEKWLLDHNSIILKHEQQYKHSTIYKFKKKN
jgi:galactose mutarotase-like enzyme